MTKLAFVKIDTDYTSNLNFVVEEISSGVMDWLEDSGQLLQDRIAANTRKETGETAASWKHETKRESDNVAVCQVKSSHPNASFEEFGTGLYAEEGHYPDFKGKIPWVYKDRDGNFHRTEGKMAQHPAQRAIDACAPIIAENARRYLKKYVL